MREEDKKLNTQERQDSKAPKLGVFSASSRKKLEEILTNEEIDSIEQKRMEQQKEQNKLTERTKKIEKLLNEMYSLSNKEGFGKNNEYKFYDEGDVIITSHEGNSQILKFDGTKFAHNNNIPYRKIGKAGANYIAILGSIDDHDKKRVNSTGFASFISNIGVKLSTISGKISSYENLKGVYIRKYKIKNNYKVFEIYDKDLNSLVKHIPEGFRVLSILDGEILFQKEQLDIEGEDFVVMHQGDDREEKRVGEYTLKDSPIYIKYLESQKDKTKG